MKTFKVYLMSVFCTCFFVSCCYTKHCEGFNENYVMFIPTNTALKDSIIFYSNYGDSISVYFDSKKISSPTEFSACEDSECTASYEMSFKDKKNYCAMWYYLTYHKNNANRIGLQISYRYLQHYEQTGVTYYPNNNLVTASTTIEDSVLVNGVYYKDVVILDTDVPGDSDMAYLDKVYVAKDMGVIMATVKNSDVVWAINKFE